MRRGIPPGRPERHDGAVTEPAPKQPDLTAAREMVMAIVAGSPMAGNPPTAQAVAPLRRLPAELEAKLASRAVLPATTEAPGARVMSRVVVPSALLAVLDAALVVAGIVSGHYVLAVVAAVLLVALIALTILGARVAARDPLRLTAADRRAIARASTWQSVQPWTGPLATCQERGLVIAAARAAERIVRSPAWRSGRLDEQRIRLDLGSELDQIDDQTHRIATARHEHGAVELGNAEVVDKAWEATLNRVAALTAYADELDGSAARRAAELTAQGDPVRDSNLLAGSVRDEMAFDQLLALNLFLNANRDDST